MIVILRMTFTPALTRTKVNFYKNKMILIYPLLEQKEQIHNTTAIKTIIIIRIIMIIIITRII